MGKKTTKTIMLCNLNDLSTIRGKPLIVLCALQVFEGYLVGGLHVTGALRDVIEHVFRDQALLNQGLQHQS